MLQPQVAVAGAPRDRFGKAAAFKGAGRVVAETKLIEAIVALDDDVGERRRLDGSAP